MWSYSGRGLQSWGRERKHAGQIRMCSWFCRCGHGKEKENGGWRIILQRIPHQRTESGPCLICYIPISARQNCPPGSPRQLLQDSCRNGKWHSFSWEHEHLSGTSVRQHLDIWDVGNTCSIATSSWPKKERKKRMRWFPSPFSHLLEEQGDPDMARPFSTAW